MGLLSVELSCRTFVGLLFVELSCKTFVGLLFVELSCRTFVGLLFIASAASTIDNRQQFTDLQSLALDDPRPHFFSFFSLQTCSPAPL